DAVQAMRDELIPHADILTPNLHEAAILVGEPVETVGHMSEAARKLVAHAVAGTR
ncbi:MAG TPA: bifunctional hydroxymethylpyrimidine kinase/phosphomethylpyrimidine kinase, partial [Acidobacteria bacterium]|nr:bifunctional hydroxymethylpyrimidine kinase/phosphomethylpyrimidine kinase [Acidobacteriota bacterium]